MSGWTMKEAAKTLGTSDSTVRRWAREWQEFVEEWQEEGTLMLTDASIDVLREIKRLRASQTSKEEIRRQLRERFTSVVTFDQQTQHVQARPMQNESPALYEAMQAQVTSVNRLADSMDDFARRLDKLQDQQETIRNLQARIALLEEERNHTRRLPLPTWIDRIRSIFRQTRILPECAKTKKHEE
ncbi:MAG: MerR family transcriptional regulator [Synergistales bacterium]|nr:MerR family transcriptional regulator [Synergistales bacterium]